MAEIILYLIRHGKTPGNLEKRYIGRTDESLSKEGKEELQQKAKSYGPADFLFSSPMKRCLETCAVLYPGQEIRQIEDLKEIDFGRFEGKNYMELSGDPEYQAWIDSNGTLPFPEGEDRDSFMLRSLSGFGKLMEVLQKESQKETQKESSESWEETEPIKVAAVVHGGTIMSILSNLFGGDYYDYQVGNGEGYECHISVMGDDYCFRSVKRIGV